MTSSPTSRRRSTGSPEVRHPQRSPVLCVDVGSTFTKAVLVDPADGAVLGAASSPTTAATDVLDGLGEVRARLAEAHGEPGDVLVCSSAGGGLRLAVVGYEREVTAEAGRRVALSAGGRVVHVACGPLDGAAVRELRAARSDIVLLVGGTDGGNADVLLANARRLAAARVPAPVVVAGNADAAAEVEALLRTAGRRVTVTGNVLPEIGVVAPDGARRAIREAFLAHVIGGKGLSRGPAFARLVTAPTPDAVLAGVERLAAVAGTDVLVVDVGGATTDVYSVLTPQGEDATLHRDVVATLWHARTVEADLGMRWNAESVVEAAGREHLLLTDTTSRYAVRVATDPGHLAGSAGEWACERELAAAAAVVAVRRHGRPAAPSERPRPLAEVGLVLGSGGVLRHAPAEVGAEVLRAVVGDHGGGWRVPRSPRTGVDTAYLLFAVGLLADRHPDAADALATRLDRSVGR
ncbi:MAG TPA: glutamate mutase L [Dermatophilaceae bacterium]|nr:glutamate mutase L [Dermatophilaceae bacterium]